MKLCPKCQKQTPTIVIKDTEECMVCGAEIAKIKPKTIKDKITSKNIENYKKITEIDENTGKYKNAQTFGRNILIGILIILAGIFYSMGGFNLVLIVAGILLAGLFLAAVFLYIMAIK